MHFWKQRYDIIDIKDVVITSVLDDDPPFVGVGGLCKIPPAWLAKWTKIIGFKIWVKTFLLGVHEACIAVEMAQGDLNLFLSFYFW